MPEAHSVSLRERVVAAYESGEGSYPEVAARFRVREASVKRWVRLFGKTGSLLPKPKGGGTASSITLAEVEALLQKLRDPTAGEITVEFNRTRRGRTRVHVSSMKRALHRLGYVVKKSGDGHWRVCGQTSSKNEKHS